MAQNPSASEKQLQQLFLKTRIAYKNFEWAAEYFDPTTSRAVNGAPVPDFEPSGLTFQPAGLQVIEGFLFPHFDTTTRAELIRQLISLQGSCTKYQWHFANIAMFDWQIVDATKLEVFRIETVGITGFDNPLTLQSMGESAVSLRSLQNVLSLYINNTKYNGLKDTVNAAIAYLFHNQDFNAFNRAEFITTYCNPITTGITGLETDLHLSTIRYNRLLNQDARTLFDSSAFNVNAYAPDPSAFVTDQKIALGKKLFTDPILSGDGTRSCQSCHQPVKAFTDGLVKNTAIDAKEKLKRNTPTLINAALQSAQFYDLRGNTLEAQSHDVIQSAVEMHGSMIQIAKRLWRDTLYRQLFTIAFPEAGRTAIDTMEVMNAMASYVRSLVLLNSPFDEYMRGDNAAMSRQEVHGFNLFMGKAKCGTCHYMPLFNGTRPPKYIKTESEVIGVPGPQAKKVDRDLGRFDIIKSPSLLHAFKTPTLRNAALTAPYMHNGVFKTLEQVLDFYDRGGGAGLGLSVENQTLPTEPLHLSRDEKTAIIAFLHTLTDTTVLQLK